MAQTVSNLADVMKEVFTSDRLEKQFYDEQPFLSRIQKTNKFTHGKKAVVPVHKGRSGGISVFSSAGGTLNAADNQKVDRAEFTVPYNYGQIKTEIAALNEAAGGQFSVGTALNLEIDGMLSDIRLSAQRQFLGNGDALIAQCTTSSSGQAVLSLLSTGYGYDAIVRGWLYAGMTIDVGTTSSETAVGADLVIQSVTESSSAPALTLTANLANAASSSHYVSIANARSGATSNESAGLRTIFGSSTSAVGGLDPDTAGEEFWQPAYVDSSTTAVSTSLLLTMQRKVHQKTGSKPGFFLTSLLQQASLYDQVQNQVRFSGEGSLNTGNPSSFGWNGMEVMAIPDVPDRELYLLTLEDLALVTGAKYSQPTWVSTISGNTTGLVWNTGTTNFVDAVCYPVGLAISRRNGGAAAIGLTAS